MFIDHLLRNSETFIRNVFLIIRMVTYTIYIQHRILPRKQRSDIQFNLYIWFVFFVFQLIEVLIPFHQALIIRSINKSRTGGLCRFVQPQGEVQLKNRKIMGVECPILIPCSNPLRTAATLIGTITTHQPGFKPGRSGYFSMFRIPYMNRPLIAGSSF